MPESFGSLLKPVVKHCLVSCRNCARTENPVARSYSAVDIDQTCKVIRFAKRSVRSDGPPIE